VFVVLHWCATVLAITNTVTAAMDACVREGRDEEANRQVFCGGDQARLCYTSGS
jgi:hypothetical protein